MGEWSASDAIGAGWERVKGDLVGLALPVLVVSVIQGVPNFGFSAIAAAVEGDGNQGVGAGIRFVSWAVGMLISAFLTGGTMHLFIKAARGEEYSLGDVFSGGRFFVPMLLTLLVIQFATSFGMLLCIVPGVVIGIGLSMAVPLVVDRELDAVSALKESWRLTTGHKMDLFVFGLLAFCVAFAGMLACCVGIIPASAVIGVAHAWIYVRLVEADPPQTGPAVF